MSTAASDRHAGELLIRRTLQDGDAHAIAELHRRVYVPEFGRNEMFVARVASGVDAALAEGWPGSGGGVWLVDCGGELCGSLALTDHGGGGVGRVRWFALTAPLRGRGLGRSLLAELLAKARSDGLHKLELETFSALCTAARMYRAAGFRLQWEHERDDWGPTIVYQGYELELR